MKQEKSKESHILFLNKPAIYQYSVQHSVVHLPITLIDSPGKSGASSICASLFPSRSAWQKSKIMSKSHSPSVPHRYILMQSAFTTRLLEHKKCVFFKITQLY